ncbi:MAG TPA: short-chain dehydrogenase/reductase [Solirubrobacterales bacterium]|jgi:NAD(P)-dependent dehydrogenase (short-subunit alcohol dehydrogenase family)|nr:short-chain dehydrogenase/reductase [Solirubrobacterales bacterium]
MPRYDLNGKVALVTGAARGIGFETARQIHLRGGSVAVVDLDPEQAREAAERIGPRALGIGADVTDMGAIQRAVAETAERFGGLDVVVANAGIAQGKIATIRGIGAEEWERVFEVDLLGVWRTVRAALPQIVERQGHVVVTSSAYAFVNGVLNSPYAIAKAGVESMGRALRVELTPLGASASVAYFGWVDTGMVQEAAERPHSDLLEANLPGFLRKRIQPDEAGAAVVRGIEERAPRIFAPKWWRYISAARGIINPLLDRRVEGDKKMLRALREIEAAADEQGAAAVSAASR